MRVCALMRIGGLSTGFGLAGVFRSVNCSSPLIRQTNTKVQWTSAPGMAHLRVVSAIRKGPRKRVRLLVNARPDWYGLREECIDLPEQRQCEYASLGVADACWLWALAMKNL